MKHHVRTLPLSALVAAALLVFAAMPVLGQDEAPAVTVAEINAGNVAGEVSLDGAILAQEDDDEFWFSDGTDVIKIDVDADAGEGTPPPLTLINIMGSVASEEIDVSSWSALEIAVPAVIRTPQEAIDAFWGWIITQNSQEIIEPAS